MSKDLYDVIEEFDTLRLELAYYLKSNKSFIEVEIADNYSIRSDFLELVSGVEFATQRLIERFETVSNELTEIMRTERAERNDNK